MVDVLVGGRKREEVLEARLRTISQGPIDGPTPPAALSVYCETFYWETQTVRDTDAPHYTSTFHEALASLPTRGYLRFATPFEMTMLLYHHHLKDLTNHSELQIIVNDICVEHKGEWLDTMTTYTEKTITLHRHPRNITSTGDANRNPQGPYEFYDLTSMTFSGEPEIYQTNGIPGSEEVPADEVFAKSPELATSLWSGVFPLFPENFRNLLFLYLPENGESAPLSLVFENNRFIFRYDYSSHSRGVKRTP